VTRERTEYHFQLPRHIRLGGVVSRLPLGLLGLAFTVGFLWLSSNVPWALIPAVVSLLLARGFLFALHGYVFKAQVPMCIAIEENGIGFGSTEPELWVHTDGLTTIDKEADGWWLLHHVNGTYLYFPDEVVSIDDIEYLQSRVHSNLLNLKNLGSD